MERRDAGGRLDRRDASGAAGSIAVPRADRRARSTRARRRKILLESLRAASRSGRCAAAEARAQLVGRDSLNAQRAALVDCARRGVARARRCRRRDPSCSRTRSAVTDAARRRFNVLARRAGRCRARSVRDDVRRGATGIARPRSTRPGSRARPRAPHFADLAALWSEGKTFTLAFTEARGAGARRRDADADAEVGRHGLQACPTHGGPEGPH